MSIKQTIPKPKANRRKTRISITEFLSIQKDQCHHPQKETHI